MKISENLTDGYTMYIPPYIRKMNMQIVIQKWGNSLGFKIPAIWAKENGIKSGSKVEVIAEKGALV